MTLEIEKLFKEYGQAYLEWHKAYHAYDDNSYYFEKRLESLKQEIIEILRESNG